MLNYIVAGKRYEANDGYVFVSKKTGIVSKALRLRDERMLENYDIILEASLEEKQEEFEDDNSVSI